MQTKDNWWARNKFAFIKWWSVATFLIMLFVLIGGALVTKTDSGDGCGTDWPLCNGQLIPDNFTLETFIEYSHRVSTGLASLFVVVLFFLARKYYGHIRETKFLCNISLGFLIIQSLFGASAVLWPQSDPILALHFGVSLISVAAIFLLNALIFEIDKKFNAKSFSIPKKLRFQTYAVTIYSYIVIYTGALVRHTNSSLACPDFPMCSGRNNGLPLTINEWVQMGHRFAAGTIFIWILLIFLYVLKTERNNKILVVSWGFAFALVALQAIAGAAVVLTELSLSIALLHALFITLLFSLLSYLILLSSRYVLYYKHKK